MRVLSLIDVSNVLAHYQRRYRWLDVFSSQVRELAEASDAVFVPIGPNAYRVQVGQRLLAMRAYPDKGVARFSIAATAPAEPAVGGAIVGAAIGALVGGGTRPKGPEGLVLGLLLGGLVGAAVGSSNELKANRVMTIRYDQSDGQWKVYDGPYRAWAKEVLQPG